MRYKIIRTGKVPTTIQEPISPYDADFPLKLFQNTLSQKIQVAHIISKDVCKAAVKIVPIAHAVEEYAKSGGCRYVVDTSEKLLEMLNNGMAKLDVGKDGQLFAQLRNANGRLGTKLPIKKEYINNNINPCEIANMMQMYLIESQLENITEQLNIIDDHVKALLLGQQNDRIALYYSGLELFLQAQSVTDLSLKNALAAQALRSLSDSIAQLNLNFQSDIDYLKKEEYNRSKFSKNKLLEEKIQSVNKTFMYIHQSSLLQAAIYCDMGEYQAMTSALNSYSRFIERDVLPNAPMLAQCDRSDDGTETGKWGSRANLKLDIVTTTKQLETTRTFKIKKMGELT